MTPPTLALSPFEHRAPAWLPGGNLQTIWAAKLARRHAGPAPNFARERWATPDGDFVDVAHLQGAARPAAQNIGVHSASANPTAVAQPAVTHPKRHLVLFHGLEGNSSSAYAQAFAWVAQSRGWAYSVPHFRGCSGAINHAPRAYHSGDFEEVGWILQRLRASAQAPLLVVGVSLGGNALLRWAQEAGAAAAQTASAVAAVCSPIDLAAAGAAIDQGFNRLVYARMFLATMKPKALAKLAQHPGLFDGAAVAAARTIYAFDNAFTAPLHGYANTPDYWARASALPHLHRLRVASLVLNAGNDPFVPAAALPSHCSNPLVTLWRPAHGGHVGFPSGPFPAQVTHMPGAVCDWLAAAA